MVAKTPPKLRRMAPLNPNLVRETVNKVDKCMARLQELQYTVSGGTKVIAGKNLSPRSTRVYLKTSIRCKQESLRMKNSAVRKSPVEKFQGSTGGDWRRMSLPAMLVGETVGEILKASQFAREIVEAVEAKPRKIGSDDPKTPLSQRRKNKVNPENAELRARRKREKQVVLEKVRLESDSPNLRRARSRIIFKVSPNKRECGKENWQHIANRVSPRNKPWAQKTVLFPNPLFHSSPTSRQHKFCKTRSPVIARARQTPHKFLIKSPPSNSKFQVKIKNTPVLLSPTRVNTFNKKSLNVPTATKPQRSFSPGSSSPTRAIVNKKSQKVSTATKLRRSLSPAKLANRFVSPLKKRMSAQMDGAFMSGLKRRPSYPSMNSQTGEMKGLKI
ncbi:hypothetical protein AQUCO_01700432v1 [Aquilegia coerulea]|uniref:Microtubule-binding protein TANGLED n=2 Tax=Aquilegia coerulea TaxID=218851 RepID=A0A2G5DMV8_AQUCA|nr:hypothetical protein AQUCO_01700432v1 [Aquilegia coerulea]